MQNLGIDIGYNSTKIYDGENKISFPSIVGTADISSFRISGNDGMIIEVDNTQSFVGDSAVSLSRIIQRNEDRNWIDSQEYYKLFLASLAQSDDGLVNIVSGLPIAFYEDKEKLKSIMEGEHNFKCKTMFSIMVNNARIIPQPFGTILDNVLDEDGDIIDEKIARGTVGVIDVGGKTTNILSATALAEKSRMTTSINVGGWDVVRAVKKRLSVTMPELDLRDHEIAQGVINGYVRAYGKNVDITEIINTTALPFAQNIVSEATQLWGTGASLDMIIVTGGGSYLVGSVIVSKFRHATISSDPIFSNVVGYFKLSRRLNK